MRSASRLLTRPPSRLAIFVALATLINPSAHAESNHPNALWRVVHNLCVMDKRILGLSAPCAAVDLKRGVAVVNDPGDPTQLLVVPTQRIAGIESPELLEPGAANYWQDAWTSRRFLDRRAGRSVPRDDVALAVNSIAGRSQNQLHIHVDCVREDVRDALKDSETKIDDQWSKVELHPGRSYMVRSVAGADLDSNNPFQLVAGHDPEAASDMGMQTVVTIGAWLPGGAPGFYVLARRGAQTPGDSGHGEELMDHGCGVLRTVSTAASAAHFP